MSRSEHYDLVIVGGTAGGLSVAISSVRSGLERIRIVESSSEVAFAELVPENQLDLGYGETVSSVDLDGDTLVITTNLRSYRATGCVVTLRQPEPRWSPPIEVPESDRICIDDLPDDPNGQDVLVVGYTDHAVELVTAASAAGADVVMAAGGMDPALLSPAGEHMLRRLERERKATILYRAVPDQIGEIDGFPVAYFADRRTPDLEFDHVVFASQRRRAEPAAIGVSDAALASRRVWFLGRQTDDPLVPTAPGWELGNRVAEACFPELEVATAPSPIRRRARHASVIEELRNEHYNATITQFEPRHSDLWILRVEPDRGGTAHLPGQYASLGLGFWEDRIDDATDRGLEDRWAKLIRRSYSISHPIFDEHGYLAGHEPQDALEFYIVLVRPTAGNVPALTPRLALKRPGDRIYLGPKVAGRYTLASITDPASTVVLLSTGTGEAPHNSMATALLRKGHHGPIVAAVTVREWADLGYLEKHRRLEERWSNYHYLPLPTREPDVPKRYIQDLIRDGDLDGAVGGRLDPDRTHVFLCGNPAMIGLPEGEDDRFPEPVGVIELLVQRGFTLDRRSSPGNIHYEEYW